MLKYASVCKLVGWLFRSYPYYFSLYRAGPPHREKKKERKRIERIDLVKKKKGKNLTPASSTNEPSVLKAGVRFFPFLL